MSDEPIRIADSGHLVNFPARRSSREYHKTHHLSGLISDMIDRRRSMEYGVHYGDLEQPLLRVQFQYTASHWQTSSAGNSARLCSIILTPIPENQLAIIYFLVILSGLRLGMEWRYPSWFCLQPGWNSFGPESPGGARVLGKCTGLESRLGMWCLAKSILSNQPNFSPEIAFNPRSHHNEYPQVRKIGTLELIATLYITISACFTKLPGASSFNPIEKAETAIN